jgi:hypothetical protein
MEDLGQYWKESAALYSKAVVHFPSTTDTCLSRKRDKLPEIRFEGWMGLSHLIECP